MARKYREKASWASLVSGSGLGFFGGAVLIGALLAAVLLAYALTEIDRVILFWIAFVLTRPFGATFGDVLTKPIDKGGLNLGTAGSSHSMRNGPRVGVNVSLSASAID